MSTTTPAEAPSGRIAQIRQAYRLTKRSDRFIGLILLGWFLGVAVVMGVLVWLILPLWVAIPLAILFGLLAALIVFGRRAERAAYAQVEGQVGAAAGTLQMLKKGWRVAPAIAFTKNQDVLHRVVGRPGIILVAEGNPNRTKTLLSTERKKHARIAEGVPIRTLYVGDGGGEDEVRLPKLVRTIQKMPKAITPGEQTELLSRIRALDAMRPAAPLPRGPVPTSAKGARRMMQGR